MQNFQDRLIALVRENERLAQAFIASLPANQKPEKSKSGLYYTVMESGKADKKATKADSVRVNYKGSLIDGSVFDQSRRPIEFPVSAVVAGFSEGVCLVGEGGKVRLYIPGELGYGMYPPPGSGIQPGSMLVFDVEIVEVIKA